MTRNTDEGDTSKPTVSRRRYVQLAAASIPVIGGVGSIGSAAAVSEGGPPNPDDWELTFEDDFDGNSLDTDNWGIGWGWGMGAPGAKLTWARDRHVNVRDSNLVLTASKEDWWSDNVLYAGNVHSKNKVTVEPPVYFEAKCKFVKGAGWQNSFWSKPNDESWPPEIDVVEYLQPSGSTSDTSHNLHYSGSGTPGDSSTHQTENGGYEGYSSSSEYPHNTYHIYGLEWREGVIRHYVDGQVVEETRDQTILDAFNNGGPEYLMLSLNLDNVGTTDKSGSWEEKEYLCDWVRVWNPSGSNTGGGGSDESDDTDSDRKYFWARSGNGDRVSFEFEATDENISRDSSSYTADYWVAEDGTTAGGTTSKTGADLPGFWFHGDIADLQYDGELELYIGNQRVDPDDYTSDDSSEDASRHYFWARSGDGNPVTFEFEASAGDVSRGSSSYTADYWVAEDGTTAGGTTSKTGADLPGFWYHGDIASLQYDGNLELYVDNERVDPDQYVDESEETPETLPKTLTLEGEYSGSRMHYEISVSEELQATETTNDADTISGASVNGYLAGNNDGYRFSGSIESISADDGVTVSIDGTPAKRIVVERSAESSGTVTYLLETTGSVLPNEGSVNSDDTQADGKVLGRVSDDVDEFWLLNGDVTDVSTFQGDVVTTVDGETVN